MPSTRANGRPASGGQSLTEFALLLPLLIVIFVAVIDLARVYTTILSIESAAREAADWGSFTAANWSGQDDDPDSNRSKTITGMIERLCTAASNTPDYVPDGSGGCTNPSWAIVLVDQNGNPEGAAGFDPNPPCHADGREPPCRVKVTLTHTFTLMLPLRISVRNVEIGFPSELIVVRDSVFAISDLEIPGPPATPAP